MTAKAKGKDSTLTASTVEQMIADAINTLMTKVGKLGVESVITDPGIDEFWKGQIGNLFNNAKRTYDEYQAVSLESIGRNRNNLDAVQNLTVQALQNAVETANMVSKQAVRHGDLAIDRQWNVDEQGSTAEKIIAGLQDPTVIAAMIAAVSAEMLKTKK